MKIEQQVVSLELAQKLKELGVPQESLFWWVVLPEYEGGPTIHLHDDIRYVMKKSAEYPEALSAYTVAELGEMLPKELGGDFGGVQMTAWVNGKEWECSYYSFFNQKSASQLDKMPHMYTLSATEADARAKMLIYLLENELIEL